MKKVLIETLQITLALGLLIGISYACKKNRFKKEVFLDELYQYKTSPEIDKTLELTNELQTKWNSYSTEMNSSNFLAAQTQFLQMANQMEIINFYNLGDVGAIYVFNRFYKTTVDTSGLIDVYNAQETFSFADIGNYTNTKKGVFALEYLLFSETFSDSLTEPKFVNFINAQLSHLESTLTEFQNSWNIYQTNFIKSEGEGVSDSYNIVINKIIHVLEDLVNKRIAKPIQQNDPTVGIGYYSNQTLLKIKTQVQQLNDIYVGTGTATFNSVYNNVRKKNKKLADKVTDKFNEIIAFGNSMNKEFDYYLFNDQTSLNTYNSLLVELLGLFKVDIQKELDIIITFGDTDGD